MRRSSNPEVHVENGSQRVHPTPMLSKIPINSEFRTRLNPIERVNVEKTAQHVHMMAESEAINFQINAIIAMSSYRDSTVNPKDLLHAVKLKQWNQTSFI